MKMYDWALALLTKHMKRYEIQSFDAVEVHFPSLKLTGSKPVESGRTELECPATSTPLNTTPLGHPASLPDLT